MSDKLEMMPGWLLLSEVTETQKAGGLVTPNSVTKQLIRCVVKATATKRDTDAVTFNLDDLLIVDRTFTKELKLESETFLLCSLNAVIARMKKA